MNANRIAYIDQLKGITILLVVLGHVIGRNAGEDNFPWRFIYSFHMPLFMFVSGYVAQMTFRTVRFGWDETVTFIMKKVRTLLLPFLMWGIMIPCCCLRKAEGDIVGFVSHFFEIWGGGLWFLATLYLLSVLFYVYRWVINPIRKKTIIVDIAVLTVMFAFVVMLYKYLPKDKIYSEGFRSVFNYFPFYFAGVVVNKHDRLNEFLLNNEKVFSFSFLFFFLLMPSFVYDMSSMYNQMIKIALSFLAIPFMFFLVRRVRWNVHADRMFQYFGRESLAIYLTHNGPFVALLAITDFVPFTSVENILVLLFLLLFSLFICYASIGIKQILSLSPELAWLFYGKSYKLHVKQN